MAAISLLISPDRCVKPFLDRSAFGVHSRLIYVSHRLIWYMVRISFICGVKLIHLNRAIVGYGRENCNFRVSCVKGRMFLLIPRAGIIGLYTGLLLARRGKGKHVTVVAEYMPGDQSVNYTSPWAGANFSLISGDDEAALRYDRVSFQNLDSLFRQFGEEAGLRRLPASEYWNTQDPPSQSKIESLKAYIPDVS
jgi:hypothetical protein